MQLRISADHYRPAVIGPGTPENGWLDFDPALGLEGLNDLISRARKERKGVRVIAPVGVTSHVGDLLRKAGVPAHLHPRSLVSTGVSPKPTKSFR